MAKKNPFDNSDENEPPSEDELRELLKNGAPLFNLEGFVIQLRKDAIKEFNKRFKNEQLELNPQNIDAKAKRWTSDLMDEVITPGEILEIFERTLEWSEEHETFIVYDQTLWKLYDEICRNIFFKIGKDLTDAGIFELRFDRTLGPNGDFTFVLSEFAIKKATAAAKKLEKQKKINLQSKKVQDEVRKVSNGIPKKKPGRPKKK
jgi:hypothetical protein